MFLEGVDLGFREGLITIFASRGGYGRDHVPFCDSKGVWTGMLPEESGASSKLFIKFLLNAIQLAISEGSQSNSL